MHMQKYEKKKTVLRKLVPLKNSIMAKNGFASSYFPKKK